MTSVASPNDTSEVRSDVSADESANTRHRVRVLTLATLAAVVTILCYENSFRGVFIFDDVPTIVNNESIRSLHATWNAESDQIASGLRRRPVVRWSLALNYAFFGLNPGGYHLVNLLIHITAGLLLFGIVRRTLLLDRIAKNVQQSAGVLACAIAVIWLVHPLQTESVTYVIQRLESMMGMFFLACVYFVLRGAQSQRPKRWYAAAVAALWLGLGTKEVVFTAPIVVLMFDRTLLASSWKELIRKRWLLYAVFALSMIVYFVVAIGAIPYYTSPLDEAGERPTSWEYLRTQPGVLLHYLSLTFWPQGQSLDLLWQVTDDRFEIYGKGAVIVGMLLASFVLLCRRHWIGLLGVAFFVILAPTSTIVPLHLAFEHRMYLPLACVVTMVVIGLFHAMHCFGDRLRWPRELLDHQFVAVVALVAVSFGLATHARNEIYKSPIAIWKNVIDVNPHNPRGHMNLANYLANAKRYDEAREHYEWSLEIKPEYAQCQNNFGIFYQHYCDNVAESLEHYREAARLSPRNPKYTFSLASANEFLDNTDEAILGYRRAIELNPSYAIAYHNLGRLLRMRGAYVEAEEMLRQALRHDPRIWKSHHELARLHAANRRFDKAIANYEKALEMAAGHPVMQRELARIFATHPAPEARNAARALQLAEAACEILAEEFESWDVLSVAHAANGSFVDALQAAKKAHSLVERTNDDQSRTKTEQEIESRIKLYEVGKPYREPEDSLADEVL